MMRNIISHHLNSSQTHLRLSSSDLKLFLHIWIKLQPVQVVLIFIKSYDSVSQRISHVSDSVDDIFNYLEVGLFVQSDRWQRNKFVYPAT